MAIQIVPEEQNEPAPILHAPTDALAAYLADKRSARAAYMRDYRKRAKAK